MNYTENYHLPQWDETDRIMRADFNQMCVDIEREINNTRAAASDDQSTAEDRTFDRICRLAYNHYCTVQTVKPFPRQIGVFHQDTSTSDEGITGMEKFKGFYQLSNGPAFTAEELFAQLEQAGPLVTTTGYSSTPLVVTFTAPANGSIDRLPLWITYTLGSVAPFTCNAVYEDLTAQQTVKSFTFEFSLSNRATSYLGIIEEQLSFHIGHQYRLKLTPVACRFDSESSIVQGNMVVTCCATSGEGSATHVFQKADENLGLLAAAAYRLVGDADEAKLLLNGEEIPAYWYRDIADGTGKIVREAVFRRNAPVQDGDSLTLKLACRPGAEATLYNWGAVLL